MVQDIWVNNYVEAYKWHKIRSYNTCLCGLLTTIDFMTSADISTIKEEDLCKACKRIAEKRGR